MPPYIIAGTHTHTHIQDKILVETQLCTCWYALCMQEICQCVCNHVCMCVWLSCILHFPLDFSCIYNAAHMHPNKSSAGGGKALSPLNTDKCGGTYKIYKCTYEMDHLSYHHVEWSHCRHQRRLRKTLFFNNTSSQVQFLTSRNLTKAQKWHGMARAGTKEKIIILLLVQWKSKQV